MVATRSAGAPPARTACVIAAALTIAFVALACSGCLQASNARTRKLSQDAYKHLTRAADDVKKVQSVKGLMTSIPLSGKMARRRSRRKLEKDPLNQ